MDFLQSLVCGIHADLSFHLLNVSKFIRDSCVFYEETLVQTDDARNRLPFSIVQFLTFVYNLPQSIPVRLNSLSPLTPVMVQSGLRDRGPNLHFLASPRISSISFSSVFSCFQRTPSDNLTLHHVKACHGLSFTYVG